MTDLPDVSAPGWKALFHRWFVRYNPLYLVSATLVLVGVTLLMESTAGQGGLLGQLSSTVVAEAYAWALIGSAAILSRRGLWRPAVMLALLTALYQCDLTLQTERSVYLGVPGMVASALWLASFGLKLRALAWAMQFRLSWSARGVAMAGAAGQVAIPWILANLHTHLASQLVALIVFGVLAAGLWTFRRTESWHRRTPWAQTVARRSARLVWAGWATALVIHVLFVTEHGPSTDRAFFIPLTLVLVTRAFHSEERVWVWLTGTLLVVAVQLPSLFSITAIMVGTALVLRALRTPTVVPLGACPADPYRTVPDGPPRRPEWTLARSSPAAIERLLTGAWMCLYLAVWMFGWRGGPLPEHALWLDGTFLSFTLIGVWKTRRGLPLIPVCASAVHLVLAERLIPAPQSNLQWSLTTISAGFGLLAVSLGVSMRLRRASPRRA